MTGDQPYRLISAASVTDPDATMIQRVADGAFIPADPANRDYAAYLAWVEEGNKPDPPSTEAPPPGDKPPSRTRSKGG
jgi:hypothetical protein